MSLAEPKDVIAVLKKLESTSSSEVYQGLVEIRNKLLKFPNGTRVFIDNNGLRFLVKFVKKPNEKILDVSLSILANLCLEDDVKVEVGATSGLVSHFVSLVAHMQKDSIVGRTCRLIGNLATNHEVAVKLHHKGVVLKLIDVVKSEDASPATKHMAVRALRLLWEVESFRVSMIRDQAVRAVATLLSSEINDLLHAVLKALATFTHRCNEPCALEIQGNGKGFEELVASMKNCSKNELAVTVIMNLCFIPEVRPLLGTAGVVESTIDLLSALEPPQFTSELVTVLCLLCRESVNRSKVRRGGGLELLLAVLRCGAHSHLETRALNAILHFVYDEVGLQLLIKEGLVPVLVQKLSRVVENHGASHTRISQKTEKSNSSSSSTKPAFGNVNKRFRVTSPTLDCVAKKSSPQRSKSCDVDHDPLGLRASSSLRTDTYITGHWSPGSSRSMELSPDRLCTFSPPPLMTGLSPPLSSLSPLSQSPPPSPLSDAYSPVCGYSSSDEDKHEDRDDEAIIDCEGDSDCETASPSINDKEDMLDIQDALNATVSPNALSRYGPIESWCLLMLSRVSHMDALVDDMVSSNTVDTLLRYYALLEVPHPRAARVLQRLTRNHHCLVPLLRSGFVLKVNARLMRRAHEECVRCSELDGLGRSLLSQMSVLAESGYGEGEIFHHLLRSTRPIQSLLIISVPHVIKAQRLLRHMMNCKTQEISGLELLLQLLADDCDDGLMDEAIESICRLAHHLGVSARSCARTNRLKPSKKTCVDCCDVNKQIQSNWENSSQYIVLELDDGSKVPAKREELCRESPMFCAMLTGGFYESGQQRVQLHDVTKDSLLALLLLMSTSGRCQCQLSNSNTDFAFEVLHLADRFIMRKVVEHVTRWILTRLAPDVVPALYVRSQDLRHVLSQSRDISKETLHFALGAQIERQKRVEMFSLILQSDYKQQFLDDIASLVKSHLDR